MHADIAHANLLYKHTKGPSNLHPSSRPRHSSMAAADDSLSRNSIIAALLTLDPAQFTALSRFLAADSSHRLRRLAALLLSPSRFLLLIRRIDSLPFPSKTLLLARLLHRSLGLLSLHLTSTPRLLDDHDDLDAALLLLALCRVTAAGGGAAVLTGTDWRQVVSNHVASEALQLSGLGDAGCAAVAAFVDEALDCRRFLEAIVRDKGSSPTSAAAAEEFVASLTVPGSGAVGVAGGGEECVICREEVAAAGACEMPCSHVFHSACVRRWLKAVNTCPTCRFELPTDDVFYEIERLWRAIVARADLIRPSEMTDSVRPARVRLHPASDLGH